MSISLSEIMTDGEKADVVNLIKAHLVKQAALVRLAEAEATYKQAAKYLTEAYFRTEGKDEYVSTIPESLVVNFEGIPYLIQIDTEGDHGHQIRVIGGIL